MKRLMVGLAFAVLLLACAKNDENSKSGMTSGEGTTTGQPAAGGAKAGGGMVASKGIHPPAVCQQKCQGEDGKFDVEDWDNNGNSKDKPICAKVSAPQDKVWSSVHTKFLIVDIQPVDIGYGVPD